MDQYDDYITCPESALKLSGKNFDKFCVISSLIEKIENLVREESHITQNEYVKERNSLLIEYANLILFDFD
jgi:hypothetical protein